MFAYMSEGSKNLQITAFRLFLRCLVYAPQVFKYCVTEGQLVNQEKIWSNKILSIFLPE